MEKMKFKFEWDDADGVRMLRPHRHFYGRIPPRGAFVEAELEFGEDEPLYAFVPSPGEEPQGRSFAAAGAGGVVLTSDPALYGSEDERRAAGRMPLKQLEWGVWNLVGDFPEAPQQEEG
jgi:hypothetical protein